MQYAVKVKSIVECETDTIVIANSETEAGRIILEYERGRLGAKAEVLIISISPDAMPGGQTQEIQGKEQC